MTLRLEHIVRLDRIVELQDREIEGLKRDKDAAEAATDELEEELWGVRKQLELSMAREEALRQVIAEFARAQRS